MVHAFVMLQQARGPPLAFTLPVQSIHSSLVGKGDYTCSQDGPPSQGHEGAHRMQKRRHGQGKA
eukprot:7928797-Prorocentrum_lima.AAC.1